MSWRIFGAVRSWLLLLIPVCAVPAVVVGWGVRSDASSVEAVEGVVVRVLPGSVSAMPGESVGVDVVVQGAGALNAFAFRLEYGSVAHTAGGSSTDCPYPLSAYGWPTLGASPYSFDCRGGLSGSVSGASITLAHVVLQCDGSGPTSLHLAEVRLADGDGMPLSPTAVEDGTLVCAPPTNTPTATATFTSTATPTVTLTPTPTVTSTPTVTPTATLGPPPFVTDLITFQNASSSKVSQGGTVTYTVTLWNHGQLGSNWTFLTNEGPPQFTLVSVNPPCILTPPNAFFCGPDYLTQDDGAPGGPDEKTVEVVMRAPCTAIDVRGVNHASCASVDELPANEWNNDSWFQVLVEGSGDLNGDGKISMADQTVLARRWGQDYPPIDIDGDGNIGMSDVTRLARKWGQLVPACP